jgi:hypothetical protein
MSCFGLIKVQSMIAFNACSDKVHLVLMELTTTPRNVGTCLAKAAMVPSQSSLNRQIGHAQPPRLVAAQIN